MKDNGKLVWIDLEMTGLNPFTDWVLEVATIVTNSQLDILAPKARSSPSISRVSRHRACDDIKELNAELKHYGDCLIKKR